MKNVKIKAVKIARHKDLSELYENNIEHACNIKVGDEFISVNGKMPASFCKSAWNSIKPFVVSLAKGKGNFYDGWMKNPNSAMISCNDGFRPVSFYIFTIE